ncbi:Na+/H+ antiporter [Gracilaria domingensis]|nr:Na+/H+ antiporter [Gracilaria domingensis]
MHPLPERDGEQAQIYGAAQNAEDDANDEDEERVGNADGLGQRHADDAQKEGEEGEDDDGEVLATQIDAIDYAAIDVLQLAVGGGFNADLGGSAGGVAHQRQ